MYFAWSVALAAPFIAYISTIYCSFSMIDVCRDRSHTIPIRQFIYVNNVSYFTLNKKNSKQIEHKFKFQIATAIHVDRAHTIWFVISCCKHQTLQLFIRHWIKPPTNTKPTALMTFIWLLFRKYFRWHRGVGFEFATFFLLTNSKWLCNFEFCRPLKLCGFWQNVTAENYYGQLFFLTHSTAFKLWYFSEKKKSFSAKFVSRIGTYFVTNFNVSEKSN